VKKFLRNFVLRFLISHAQRRISEKNQIIGITGSVGKTTTKEAAAKILRTCFETLASGKSMNSEFGITLTLLEEESGFSNPFKWMLILLRAKWKSFSKIEAEKIVLEFGIDQPGDLARLLEIAKPKIGVFLNAKPVHLAIFRNIAEIAREKSLLIEQLPKNGVAILNADDEFSRGVKTVARKIFFGEAKNADLRVVEIRENTDGIRAKILWKNEKVNFEAPILGRQNLPSILAGIAVGLAVGVDLKKAVEILKNFHLPSGRLNLLAGMNDSKIIDGSYNSNPASTTAALETFRNLKTGGKKIAVLGQMNELGETSEKYHREVGVRAAEIADEVVAVFGDARFFAAAAREANKPTQFFEKAETAGEWLKTRVKKNDLILVKGSQNCVRLERVVEKILANPKDQKFLCRQEKAW